MMWLSGRQEWSHRNLTASNALSLDNFIKSMGLVIWLALRPQVSERRKYQICQLWSDADDLCLFPSRREWISARHDYETIVIVRQTGLTPNSNGFDWVFLTIWFSLLIRTQSDGQVSVPLSYSCAWTITYHYWKKETSTFCWRNAKIQCRYETKWKHHLTSHTWAPDVNSPHNISIVMN